MPCSNIVLVLVWCISLVMGNQEKEQAWKKHAGLVSMRCFTCTVPQRKIVYLEDLVKPVEWKSKYEHVKDRISPAATVLHMCDNAGYCDKWDERCLPTAKENITLTFAIIPDRLLKNKTFTYFDLTLENHTECACQKIVDTDIKK